MDFQLGSLFQAATKVDLANSSCNKINNIRIKTVDVLSIQFSDESYSWNPANLSLTKLDNKYKQSENDELTAGKTYKEFWDAEETTALKDFVVEHFGVHDSALFRYSILLIAILMVALGFILRPKLMQYLYPD